MSSVKNVWDKLNGGKTFLGLFVLVVYVIATENGYVDPNQDVLTAIEAVIGVGVGHKFLKAFKS